MLPEAKVFPGAGWKALPSEGEDEETEDRSATCEGLEDAFTGLDDSLEEKLDNPAGSASREYEMERTSGAVPFPVSIEVDTEIHKDRGALKEGIKAFDTLLHSPEFEQCMREAMQAGAAESGAPEGLSVELKMDTASAPVPRDGSGVGMEAKIAVESISIDIRMEFYAWRIGNAAAFVFISGARDEVTDEFVRNVLDRIDGAAIIAARNN